jgi:hypothetical protein
MLDKQALIEIMRTEHAPWPTAEAYALVTIDTHRTVERTLETQLPEYLAHDMQAYYKAVLVRLWTLERAGKVRRKVDCCLRLYNVHWHSVK